MTTPLGTATKDPDAVLDYTIDWTSWLSGDAIVSSSWLADAGITIDSDTNNATSATVWLSGGDACRYYTVTNRVTTAAGRTDDRSILVEVKEK